MLTNLNTHYKMIESKVRAYYDDKLKSYRGRIIAGIVAAATGIATLSLAGWIYVAMLAGAITVAGAAMSIPGIIIMGAVIALCIYLVGVNSDHHHYCEQHRKLNKHEQHIADHAHDSTHATVQAVLNANPSDISDVSPPSIPLLDSEYSSKSDESSSSNDCVLTVAENRAPSPD